MTAPDWADALAEEFVHAVENSDREHRPLVVKFIATKLRTAKAQAQGEAITVATEEIKKVFGEHGIGGGNR